MLRSNAATFAELSMVATPFTVTFNGSERSAVIRSCRASATTARAEPRR